MVQMEREDNKSVTLSTQAVQEYGEGSEYGKAAREEARRKKYGRQAKSYKLDNQPWHLSFMEQGQVDDWHKFLPAITHKTLDIDQAEEKFLE
ncbi:hypothetical protein ANCCAN_26937 [Ancylostoma caninum]|uniref:Transcription initiation factor IIF subunit alpha n=1 Tax=Ancylostoma caninum TaxID=29170 RepID=A0A368F5D2_ANCCA|nr:hypothetical protein ANCCAN_26937 [Ancylostoma caninum]